MAAHLDIILGDREGMPGSNQQLLLDDIHTGDHLCDGVLNLNAGVHLDKEEIAIFIQEHMENEQEIYRIKQEIVDKDMRIDTANKLVIEYKTKVNELQKRIIELETRNDTF